MKKFFNEFKEFALRGNILNIAVGVIIGGAFQGVVTSLTNNLLSPIIGLFVGQNFDTLSVDVFGATITYGAFITSVINFLLLALVVFFLVKGMNKLFAAKAPAAEPAPEAPSTRTCPYCASEININAVRCPLCTSQLEQA
ncbi:MAG: large conductance mechanosensitive channel protein MscL [Clostridiales bacterium]|nr:large conductance mechanosensitive channel protein MscL [Clostridiales bacterium]